MSKSVRRQGGVSMVLVLIVLLAVALISSGTLLALYFGGVIGGAGAQVVEGAEPQRAAPIYVPMEPPLVVNFERNGRMGYLQVTMQAMTREPEAQQALATHMPVIRNNLLMLISTKTYADVDDREGKERLREEALEEINRVLEAQRVRARVEDLYFTGFVMQ